MGIAISRLQLAGKATEGFGVSLARTAAGAMKTAADIATLPTERPVLVLRGHPPDIKNLPHIEVRDILLPPMLA